jgi:pimeloyl-ACP methyl ester carboxylesterase
MMKDRAGVVGANGVGPLVAQLVEAPNVRVHLIGHSYGAKVVLSAVVTAMPDSNARKRVDSILLLQPAVSAYSFASDVPTVRRPGKYRPVLDHVRQPVFSTFSKDDWPLTQIYQKFVVRDRDLGEAAAATAAAANADVPPPPPNAHAALGGFGPQPLDPQGEFRWTRIQSPSTAYVPPPGARVLGLWSKDGEIACHGCISNRFTWWALWAQVAAK